MSNMKQGEDFTPIGDVGSAIQVLESNEFATGTAVQVCPFRLYVHLLLGLGAEIAQFNMKDYFTENPHKIPERGHAPLMNVFPVSESSAFVVIRTRDRDWLLHALRMITEEQATRGQDCSERSEATFSGSTDVSNVLPSSESRNAGTEGD